MPANKPAGGVNPVEKTTKPNLATPKNWFSDRLLICVIAIFLLIILFFIGFSSSSKLNLQRTLKQQGTQKGQEKQVSLNIGDTSKLFGSNIDKQRFDELITSNQFTRAFVFLSGDYNNSPYKYKREALLKLADYIKINFADQAKEVDLTIPCREESCGAKLNYSEELSSIKSKIDDEKNLNETEKQTALYNLNNAALAAGRNDKFGELNGLNGVFQNLKNKYLVSRSESLKRIAQDILRIIDAKDEQFYTDGQKLGFLKLE